MILVAMGPTDTVKLNWLSISSRMLHRLSARCGRIADLWEEFRSRGSCFRQPSWRVFFPMEIREAKVEEFINLKKGSMIVREYFLKFVILSSYVTSLVSNSRDEMSRFLIGISQDLEEEWGSYDSC